MDKPCQGLGIEPSRRRPLAGCQGVPLDSPGGDVENEQACAQALPAWHVFARGQNQAPRGLDGPKGAVLAHTLPAAVIALRPYQAIRFPVISCNVGLGASGAKIINDQQGVFRVKRQPL